MPPADSLPSVIVLSGDDSLGLEKAKEQLFERLYSLHGSIQEEYFDSSKESLDSWVTRLMTPTIFGDARLFHIKHVQKLNKFDTSLLADTLKIPIDGVNILVEYDPDKRKKTAQTLGLKKLEKSGQLIHFDFKKPRNYEMSKWLVAQVRTLFDRSISESTAEQLASFADFNPDRIYSELQKLDIYLPEKGPITSEAIEAVTGVSRSLAPSDLNNAIGHRRWEEAYTALDTLFAGNSFTAIQLNSSLFRHIWILYKIRVYAEENRSSVNRYFKTQYKEKNEIAADIAVAVGIFSEAQRKRVYPAVVIPQIIEQATKYSKEELSTLLIMISNYDRGIKGGGEKPGLPSFRELCYKMVRFGKSS